MNFNPDIHHRKSIRIKEYDYSQEGIYFITICCKNRGNIFGNVKGTKVELNQFGQILYKELINLNTRYNNSNILKYIVMPDHIHFVIELKSNNIKTIGDIIKTYKSITNKKINKIISMEVWQRNYYEHIVRNEKELYNIYQYIENNPINWKYKTK